MNRLVLIIFFGISLLLVTNISAQDCEKENFHELGKHANREMYAHYNKKDYKSAIESCLKKEAYYLKSESWPYYIMAVNDKAFLYDIVDDLASYKKAVFTNFELAERHLERDHSQWLRSKEQLNTYYYRIGDYQSALDIIKEVIPLKEKFNQSKDEIARSYLNLGTAYNKMKDYENALSSFKKSIKILSEEERLTINKGERFNNIARVYKSKGELDSALYYLQMSESLFDTIIVEGHYKQKKVETLILLAESWLEVKKYEKAKYYLDLSKDMGLNNIEKVLWNEHVARFYREINENRKSRNAIIEANNIAEKFGVRYTPPLRAGRIIELAKTYLLSDQYDRALDILQEGLLILSPSFNAENIHSNPPAAQLLDKSNALIILQEKARILFDKHLAPEDSEKYLESAFETYLVACDVIKDVRQGIRSKDSKNDLSERTISVYAEAIECAHFLFELTNDVDYISTAFELAESNKAQLLLESLNEQEARGFAGIPDSLAKREKGLRLYLAALEDNAIREGRDGNNDDDIFKLKEELNQYSSLLEKSYPRYFKQKYNNDPIEPSYVQEHLLDGNTALIEYFVGIEKIYVFVITKDAFRMDELDKESVDMGQINTFRNMLKNRPGGKPPAEEYTEFVNTSRSVYGSFVKAALEGLSSSINTLIVVPDDQINYIPFEVLLLNDPNGKSSYSADAQSYLFEDYAVNYNYSATLLDKVRTKRITDFKSNFIGYAPTFEQSTTEESRSSINFELTNLKCNRDEVSNIRSIIGGEKRISETATKDNFLNEVKDYKIIHLATHAFVNLNDSKLNRIFLQDDFLSEVNLYNLELNTELAVLSACNTGSGELLKGEGVMNLARGFINAGCSSTLMSMWSVDDCTTGDLMLLFYEELRNGLSKDQALQKAKMNYLASANKTKLHPYYWAAFVPFGDMKAMDLKSNWSLESVLPIGAMIGVLLLIAGFFYRKNKK